MIRSVVLAVILFFSFHETCCAIDIEERIQREINTEEMIRMVPDDVNEMLGEYDDLTNFNIGDIFGRFKNHMVHTFQSQLTKTIQPIIRTFMVVLFCNVLSILFPEKNNEFPIVVSGCSAITYLNLNDVQSYFLDCLNVIQWLYDFSTALLPCLASASIFTGATISAGVKYTAAALFMNILLNFCNTVVVPLIQLYLVTIIGNSVFKHPVLGTVSNGIYKLSLVIITGAIVIFTTYLSVAGLVTGTGELLAARITKMTLSNGLPIVGKIISDTASTLVAGASLLRNGIGLFGMLVLIGVFIFPLLSIGCRFMLYKLLSGINAIWTDHLFDDLLKGIANAYGMMFAVIGSGFIMMFLSILSFLEVVGR